MLSLLLSSLGPILTLAPPVTATQYFKIHVVDDQTGRGVPLVELETVNQIHRYTDSNGLAAFHEPGLMNQTVFVHVRSHGYEFPKDGFGFRGKALNVRPGGSAVLRVKRLNVAERLYRVTGQGVYRDTVILGRPAPIREPLLNGLVFGSDSVVQTAYRDKLHWFWGDTNRPAYPLGNFHVPGATSLPPGKGGLDPEVGVDLRYFVDSRGFAKETCHMPGDGPTWIGGLVTLREADGRERMFAAYVKVRGQLDAYEHGLVEWDDAKEQFRKLATFPEGAPAYPGGHTFVRKDGGVEYVYFATPFPLLRVRAAADALVRLTEYEAFTPLKEGSTRQDLRLDRGGDGRVRYAWKKNAPVVGPQEQAKLLRDGKLKPDEALLALQDVDTGKPVLAHAGTVYWNDYRRRWVMIAVESFGTSVLGEVWYAEADHPLRPWVYARKVVTHDRYSFYNPKQHPAFDKDGGRVIFFEGTYTHTFSGNPVPTPRYDYNQIMYKLDLSDPRLNLPVAVYVPPGADRPDRFVLGSQPRSGSKVAFFALDRPGNGTIPVYAVSGDGGPALVAGAPGANEVPRFHALPSDAVKPPGTVVPLYEFTNKETKARAYTTDVLWSQPGFRRSEKPLCRVWQVASRAQWPMD